MSDLIENLSGDLRPVSRWYVPHRLGHGISGGLVISILVVLFVLKPRPDMGQAMHTAMFWIKLIYPLSLALIATMAAERLARPVAPAGARIAGLAVPLAVVFALAGIELLFAPPASRGALLLGSSARVCPFLVLALAIPPLLGSVWAMRGLAPTRLRATGMIIGLGAGGAGAFAYAWHCTETGAPFLAMWYTLGIVFAAFLGWLVGPFVLRWR